MRRWTMSVGLVLVALNVTQCSNGTSRRTPPTPTTSKAVTTSVLPGPGFDACMVTDAGGINDASFHASAYQGLEDARAADSTVHIQYLQPAAASDYAADINALIAANCGIIVTVGYLLGDATESAARSHPAQKFAIVDDSYSPPLPNVKGLIFNSAQSGFLGGYLAAGMSRTGSVATFGGQHLPPVTNYMDGFWEGVQYYNGVHHADVTVFGWDEKSQSGTFTGNFTDEAKGEQVAQTFVQRGADVIFPVAGGVGLGAAAAVQRAGHGVHLVWVDTDGCVSAPQYCSLFISSVTKGIAVAVEQAVDDAASGAFAGGDSVGTLANNGVGLAPFHDFVGAVPAALKAELDRVRQGIASGSITISSPSQPAG